MKTMATNKLLLTIILLELSSNLRIKISIIKNNNNKPVEACQMSDTVPRTYRFLILHSDISLPHSSYINKTSPVITFNSH